VVIAPDGQAGLEEARRQKPDVVITDVNMPVMGGVALAIELRRDPLTSEGPILMLTSDASGESETAALSAGAGDYIVKPVQPRRLAARIRSLLTRAGGSRSHVR